MGYHHRGRSLRLARLNSAPISERLGYTTSAPIYLPATHANGMTITLTSGYASVHAGAPGADGHRHLTGLNPGDTYTVDGIGADEVISSSRAAAPSSSAIRPGTPEAPSPGCRGS